jgi:Copper amine oxidase N-terminal domain
MMNRGQFMKKTEVITGILALSLIFSSSSYALAVSPPKPDNVTNIAVTEVKLSEKGSISYAEFIRAVVVEVSGEQPILMDTHYAMPYMLKAKELELMDEIPMEQWSQAIPYTEMNVIIDKLTAAQKQNVKTMLNSLLVDAIDINETPAQLGDLKIFVQNGNVMIPLRKTAEALGFTITWNENNSTATIDNGDVKTDIQIGFDNYYKQSSSQIGLTQAKQLGTAPMLIDGITYIPAQMYNLLFSNPNAAVVKDGKLSITNK